MEAQLYYCSTDGAKHFVESYTTIKKGETALQKKNQEMNSFLKQKGAYYYLKK